MNVVRSELIKDKINQEINKDNSVYGEIERIELNDRDFRAFVTQIDGWGAVVSRRGHRSKVEDSLSGDYVVWRGVCVQHHESYE